MDSFLSQKYSLKKYSVCLNQLRKQQTIFHSFMASLNKKPQIRQLPEGNIVMPDENQTKNYPYHQVLQRQSTRNKKETESKQKIVSNPNCPQDFPAPNFRITAVKQKTKSLTKNMPNNSSLNQSLIKASNQKIKQSTDTSPSKFTSKTSSSFKPNLSRYQQSNVKTQSRISKKLKFSKTTDVTWNPQHQQFTMPDMQSQRKPFQSKSPSRFQLDILKVEASQNMTFFKQRHMEIQKLSKIQGKQLCSFFQEILELNKIEKLKEPLIKKYNNCLYYGQKPNFQQNHPGIIIYFNGNAYIGQFKLFQKHGLGVEFIISKNLPETTYQPCAMTLSEYVIYRGKFTKNSKTGQFLIQAQNYVYNGSVVKGLFQGQGTLVTENSQFKGVWSMNKKLQGIETFKKQNRSYEGQYLQEIFDGNGKLRCEHQFYEGQFKKAMKHGRGMLVNGDYIYEGDFQNDKKHGLGIYFDKKQFKIDHPNSDHEAGLLLGYTFSSQFQHDRLLNKIEYRPNRKLIQSVQSLQTLQEQKTLYQTTTQDFDSIRPSKILDSYIKDKVPSKSTRKYKKIVNPENEQQNEKIFRKVDILRVFPSEPEQQFLHCSRRGNRISNLQGSRGKLSSIKYRKIPLQI